MERLGFGERQIRFEIESTDFQTILADDSKREKVEEIPKIIFPQLISLETERIGRIWKETAAACARVSGGGGGARRKTGLTDGPHLSAAERERRAAARRTGPAGPRRERREVLGRLSAQSQKKTF